MDAASWGFIGTIVGAIVGALASIATTVLSSGNEARLQREADTLERMERARAFQRETLLDVQDALQASLRFMGRAHHEDVMAFKQSGVWGKSLLSDEVDNGMLVSTTRLSALIERVADDSLRASLKDVHSKIIRPSMSARSELADAFLHDAMTSATALMGHLGEVLRRQY